MTKGTPDRYTVTVSENGRPFSRRTIHDPFIHTYVRPCGWRIALDVLLGRYEVAVAVNADSDTVEKVLELDPDYLGWGDSPRRREWNVHLNESLRAFANGDCGMIS